MNIEINDADRIVSLLTHPLGVCDFCNKVVCVCKPITKPKTQNEIIEAKKKVISLKERKRQRALQKLMEIFGEGDQPLCQFN
jgi:hypothetical protein